MSSSKWAVCGCAYHDRAAVRRCEAGAADAEHIHFDAARRWSDAAGAPAKWSGLASGSWESKRTSAHY